MPSSIYAIRMDDREQAMVLEYCCSPYKTCGKITARRIPSSDKFNHYGMLAICEEKQCPRKAKDSKYEIGTLEDGSIIYLRTLTKYKA